MVKPQLASRKRSSDGFSIVTNVFGGTLLVSETLAPITELAPTTCRHPGRLRWHRSRRLFQSSGCPFGAADLIPPSSSGGS